MKLIIQRRFPSPGKHLCGLAWDGHALWHSDADTDILYQIDPDTGRVIRELACPEVRTGLCYEGGFLWQVAGRPKRILQIDPTKGAVRGEIPLGTKAEQVCGLLMQADTYWIGPEQDDWISRYLLDTQVLDSQYGPVQSGDGLIVSEGRLWYTSYRSRCLAAFEMSSGEEIGRFELAGLPTDACYDGELLWFNDFSACAICAV